MLSDATLDGTISRFRNRFAYLIFNRFRIMINGIWALKVWETSILISKGTFHFPHAKRINFRNGRNYRELNRNLIMTTWKIILEHFRIRKKFEMDDPLKFGLTIRVRGVFDLWFEYAAGGLKNSKWVIFEHFNFDLNIRSIVETARIQLKNIYYDMSLRCLVTIRT